MANINLPNRGQLVKLSDSKITLRDSAEDIRGKDVIDSKGEEIGTVSDLFVDEQQMKVRFLEVGSGGFLGIGETTFLIPVDAITSINNNQIIIGRQRDWLTKSPKYNPSLVDERFLNETYRFYGSSPFWGTGYSYPSYPFYTNPTR